MPKFIPPRTRFEDLLCHELSRQGIPYVRNAKVRGYYPDITLIGTNILIEVDGGYHRQVRQRDRQRSYHLNYSGYRVLRFKNEQITEDMPGVMKEIKRCLSLAAKGRSGISLRKRHGAKARKKAAEKAKLLNRRESK